MVYRLLSLLVLTASLAMVLGTDLKAQDKAGKNTHDGTFIKATSDKEFVMEDKGKEHSHTLSVDAKVIGQDGKDTKLKDLSKGQRIRVTTKEGDLKIATRVEALKKEKKE
jgi:hypothetical protein